MSVEEGELQNVIEGYDIDNGGTIDKHEFADLVAELFRYEMEQRAAAKVATVIPPPAATPQGPSLV